MGSAADADGLFGSQGIETMEAAFIKIHPGFYAGGLQFFETDSDLWMGAAVGAKSVLELYFGKEGFKNLRACLDSLPVEDSDVVFEDVVCLCAEYERIAFTAGLKLGAQLMLELAGETSVDQ